MELQLHDNGLSQSWFRRRARQALRYYPNPYYQAARFAYRNRPGFLREGMDQPYQEVLQNITGTPTYYQFLRETGLEENDPQLASRFGRWVKTKALPKVQGIQKALSPVIGLLPGGGVVNAAFDIINRPKDGSVPGAPIQPVIAPEMPAMQPALQPAMPQFAPSPYAGVNLPPVVVTPGGSGLPFGLDWKTLGLIGLGGLVLYRTLKK